MITLTELDEAKQMKQLTTKQELAKLTRAVEKLGFNDAITQFGAIESMTMELTASIDRLNETMQNIAETLLRQNSD